MRGRSGPARRAVHVPGVSATGRRVPGRRVLPPESCPGSSVRPGRGPGRHRRRTDDRSARAASRATRSRSPARPPWSPAAAAAARRWRAGSGCGHRSASGAPRSARLPGQSSGNLVGGGGQCQRLVVVDLPVSRVERGEQHRGEERSASCDERAVPGEAAARQLVLPCPHLLLLRTFCGQFHRMRSGNGRRLQGGSASFAGQRACALRVAARGCYRVARMSRSDGGLTCGGRIVRALDAILSHPMRASKRSPA
jgi:hypothetical protein